MDIISTLKRKNFEPEEFFASETACERNITNHTEDIQIIINLNRTADLAQEIRNLLKHPVHIISGYRSLELNRIIGSHDKSQHLIGEAIDFICPRFGTPEEIAKYLKKNKITIDQCLIEGSWLHISKTKTSENRNEYAYYLLNEKKEREKIFLE